VHLLDDDGRTVLANLAYDAWGQLMSGSNPTPHGYKAQGGYYIDSETGLHLLGRYLDSATGRFLTRDPIGIEGGINLYVYNHNQVIAPPEQQPGQGTGGGNGYKPVPPPRLPRPPFISRCICILGLLLCSKPTAPPQADELNPGPEPPCSDYERQGYQWANERYAASQCREPGDILKGKPRKGDAKICPGGTHFVWQVSKSHHISVVCCPCTTPSGVTSQRCKCWRKPNKWK
jgi:RHS repeat-associated protein